ncbi:hypothetical protein IKP85_04935 [bacterium]|nr:hypothetical protein [bacterium]
MKRKSTDNLINIVKGVSEDTFVEKPCKIIKVHSQNLVDIEYYDKYKTDILCKVPVKHLQTQNSCVYIKLHVGDMGTVRFFDNDVSYYNKGSEASGNDDRSHNINDGIFSLGFYPAISDIEELSGNSLIIKSGNAGIFIDDEGNIKIIGKSVTIKSDNNTTIDGSVYLNHRHVETGEITNGVAEN